MYQEEEVCSPIALLRIVNVLLEYTNHVKEYLAMYVFFTDETMMISICTVIALF